MCVSTRGDSVNKNDTPRPEVLPDNVDIIEHLPTLAWFLSLVALSDTLRDNAIGPETKRVELRVNGRLHSPDPHPSSLARSAASPISLRVRNSDAPFAVLEAHAKQNKRVETTTSSAKRRQRQH